VPWSLILSHFNQAHSFKFWFVKPHINITHPSFLPRYPTWSSRFFDCTYTCIVIFSLCSTCSVELVFIFFIILSLVGF
jgi:hypothetical protein